MRKDISDILSHIDLDSTIKEFGEPKDNASKCVVKCAGCGSVHLTTIKLLKNRLSKKPGYFCNPCIGKMTWTQEKRDKIQNLWNDNVFRESERTKRKKRWENQSYKQKMLDIIHKRGADHLFKQKMSEITRSTWKDESTANKIKSSIINKWNTENYRNNQLSFKTEEWRSTQSSKQKEVWERSEYRKNITELASKRWQDSNYREYQSRIQKEAWLRPGYVEKQSLVQKRVWENPAYREKFKKIWESEDYKNRLSEAVQLALSDERIRIKLSNAAKRRWDNLEYRRVITDSVKKAWQNEDYKNNHRQSSIDWWNNPLNREKCAQMRAAQSGKQSSIEVITENILKSLGIEFTSQKAVGPYVFDFHLDSYDVYIECQGEYWHSLPGRKERDAAKLTYLEKAAPDSRILYLNEIEFLNPVRITEKISKFLTLDRSNDQFEFNLNDIKIRPLFKDEYTKFLNSYHYASSGRSGKYSYGAFIRDELIAVVKYSSVIRQEVATSIGISPRSTLELDRFCIHPSYHKKNFASWFISKSILLLFKESDVKCLVSFADSTYGHKGTIYKASNWKFIGIVKPDYFYVNEEGFILHKKTLYNRAVKMSKTEKEYADLHGYMKNYGREKYKYIYMKKE
jgi:very-short-patch-repair endonuclease